MLYREIIAVCSEIHTKHTNTLCGQNVELLNVKLAVYKDPVRTAQKTLFISAIKISRFMLHRVKVAVCSDTNTKHTNALWRRKAKFSNVKSVCVSNNQYGLRG